MTGPKITTEIFIQRAREKHGDKYDYSKVEYKTYREPVCIICREHGEFWQKPSLHLSDSGCPYCAGRAIISTEYYIEKAQKVHGTKYDYSQVEYTGNSNKIHIICPIHGDFWQRANRHLNGHGCPKCGIVVSSSKQKKWTREKCFKIASQYTDYTIFCKEQKSLYVIAARNGWLEDYTWLIKNKIPNGTWNKENVLQESRKYISRIEFRTQSPGAYNAAQKNGWIKEMTWFPAPKNIKKWDQQTCHEEATKYKTKTDFRKQSTTAYCIARDNGWLNDYTWFVSPESLWNHEKCYAEAKKYISYADFRSSTPVAYNVASKRGWLKEYTWLLKEAKEAWNRKWNYDTCYAEAKKYPNKAAFGKYGAGAYDMARRNGWLADYTWFPDFTKTDSKVDSVYRYYFKEQNAVYVGRTLMYRQHLRDVEHRWMENDTVLKYAKEQSVAIPIMEILEENLTIEEGKIRENDWVNYYKEQGLIILNKAATGKNSSSVGAIDRGKWTFEKAYEIAKCYNSVSELCEEYGYLYKLAKVRGWMEKFDWFRGEEIRIEKQTIWTEDVCRNEALKYKSRTEFRAANKGAYSKTQEMGWLESYDWLERPTEWNDENCREEALLYNSRFEFQKKSYGAYKYALKNNLLDQLFPKPLRRVFNLETCKHLASRYKSMKDLIATDISLYYHCKKRGYLKEFTWLIDDIQKHNYWNKETCFEEAKKHTTKSQFQKNGKGAYQVALQNHWLDEYTWFEQTQKPNGYWNQKTCYEEAQKYTKLIDFSRTAQRAYLLSIQNNWLKDYTWLSRQFVWTYELCKEEAQKYTNRGEFKKAHPSAYSKSRKNGWLDEFFPKPFTKKDK